MLLLSITYLFVMTICAFAYGYFGLENTKYGVCIPALIVIWPLAIPVLAFLYIMETAYDVGVKTRKHHNPRNVGANDPRGSI